MCGICGIVSSKLGERHLRTLLGDMNDSLVHRGPDDEGIFCTDGIGLGHRRLSIIDLAGGHQPMQNREGSVTVVFNGEIYNYRQLRKELLAKGHVFSTNSDTEVILNQYLEDGIGCLDKLRGMFAFAIWDDREKRLYLARDRIGIKPLYYAETGEGFIFASEIKALLKSGFIEPEMELNAVDSFLTVGLVPSPQTMFRGIRKLPPGCYALVDGDGNRTIRRYWSMAEIPINETADIDAAFEREIMDAVESHLVSDVPLGVFLSGGLDSSAIVALMQEAKGQRIETFSIGYRDQTDSSELGYARLVAQHFDTVHHEHVLEPMDFFEAVQQTLRFTDEPIDQPSAIALYELAKFASRHVKVVLSGEGMDEILAGYPIYSMMARLERYSAIYRALGGRLWTRMVAGMGAREKLVKHLDWLSEPLEGRYHSVNCYLTRTTRQAIYNRELLERATVIDSYFSSLLKGFGGYSQLQKMNMVDLCSWIPDSVLVKADRMSMAASLELRVPFLDHRFVEFCVALPDRCKISNGSRKHLLREFMRDKLPETITSRPKKGFPVPIGEWFRGELYGPLHDVLAASNAINRDLFKKGYVTDRLREHHSGKVDNSGRLFLILVLELWYRSFIDR